MKALVLSGGKGTRLRPLTFTTAKQLIPVANKPIVGHVLTDVFLAGITDVGIIIAPETGEEVKSYIKDGKEWGFNVTFIPQKPLGLAHAVKTAKNFLGNDNFLMYLGDNLLGTGVSHLIERFQKESLDALILLKEVKDPKAFGVAVLDENGNIKKLVEKPKEFISNLALVGVYVFSPNVHKAIEEIKPSWRGELEITDAIQRMIEKGYNVKAEILSSWWLDTGKKDDILLANATVLDEKLSFNLNGDIINSKIEGRVDIAKTATIKNSTIRGPVVVGENCIIESSYIGPFTSIGNSSKVINSSLEYSILLEGSDISNVKRLHESLIGRYAKVSSESGDKGVILHLGDYSEVEL